MATQRGRLRLWVFWAVWLPILVADAQGTIYKGLWGGLFKRHRNHTGILDAWQKTTEGWREHAQVGLLAGLVSDPGASQSTSEGLWNATLSLMDDGRDPEQSGLLQELAGSLAHADPKLLATAALLQGWVLSSVLKKAQEASSGSDAAALLERLKYPVPLPDPQWPSFEPALCMRLQNFAQAEGFREAYLFQGACNLSAPVQRAGADFAWGAAGTFGLDCSLSKPEAALAPAPEPEPSKASWISELSLPSHRRTCTLGDYLLRRLKLNGRPLLPPSGRAVENVVAEDCTTQLYYVKPRSGTGRGEAASLDIALGQYFFGSAALSILRGDTA
ncbi:hypothetical protein QBZ16_004839 [Prototheca wickerhamii]|uniref:Uncharacterized protein n=1 Tax=Prototheca wickerhamii TaxID=3111 RepID=A0AAD9MJX7_PROWI|nr:hypothetical protein QBZ16_004839 [Prototheca wickerhamii]